jgi:hypothetical protein
MLGPCVAVPNGEKMAELATYCARIRELQIPVPLLSRRRERLAKRRIAPRLAALLWDSLAQLDAEPLEHFAAIVRRLEEYKADPQPALPFEEKALRLADVARLKGEPPLTRGELMRRMGVSKKQHDDASRERKALKRTGISFALDKHGHLPKQGTRKRGT